MSISPWEGRYLSVGPSNFLPFTVLPTLQQQGQQTWVLEQALLVKVIWHDLSCVSADCPSMAFIIDMSLVQKYLATALLQSHATLNRLLVIWWMNFFPVLQPTWHFSSAVPCDLRTWCCEVSYKSCWLFEEAMLGTPIGLKWMLCHTW